MIEFVIGPEHAGARLDKCLARRFRHLSYGQMQKLFRNKDIKINGKPARPEARLSEGDAVRVYADEALLQTEKKTDRFLAGIRPRLRILYEDERLLIVDKPAGLICHPDEHEKVRTLLTEAQAYLYQKGAWEPGGFAPALCNRIDRFTGGLVMIARTEACLKELDDRIRRREVEKRYLCVAVGRPKRQEGLLRDGLIQPAGAKRVKVARPEEPGAKLAETRFRVLAADRSLSLIECELLTGRTHQIRAQLAHAGAPLLGDTQYGDAAANRRYGRNFQALYAWKLGFHFSSPGCLEDLNGRSWQAGAVPFLKDWFPEFSLSDIPEGPCDSFKNRPRSVTR